MPDVVQLCEWFAMCANPADGMMPHPILTAVPCCKRCAEVVGAADQLVEGTCVMTPLKKGDVVVLHDGRRAEVDAMSDTGSDYVWLWVGDSRTFDCRRVSDVKQVVFRRGVTPELAHNHAVNEERFHAHPGGAAPHWHRSVTDAANVSGYRVRDIEEGDANWGEEPASSRRPVHGV